ncbi:MAG: hypothetical protein M3Y03_01290 [Verrucomicrobiota bacterium]|nr:hypothetical protein [Verrucomicrobiota bacterium]
MPNDQERSAIEKTRASLTQQRAERDGLIAQLAGMRAQLEQSSRAAGPNDEHVPILQRKIDATTEQLGQAHDRVREIQDRLGGLIGEWIGDDADGDFSKLDARFPIVLLPVRIETRFDLTPGRTPSLKLRVYPDEIFADTHEQPLTPAELNAGNAYWVASKDGENVAAWRDLLAGRPPERAAWVALATDPKNPLTPGARAETWTRAAEARVLPDRWVALAYRDGKLVRRATSSVIIAPLALTLNPNSDPKDVEDISGDGLTLGRELLWTVDFERAKEAGMGFEMLLDSSDIEAGFDRLIVTGVKSSLSTEQAATELSALLEAHHFTRGLAFVRQGTPTNNTTDKPSGYPPPDPNGEMSFAVERGASPRTAESDGTQFMRALGVTPETADHLAGADLTEQKNARAMNDALWPGTIGYFLEQFMETVLNPRAIEATRRYFSESVRGRGPLPAFRIGSVPYALLPVSSLGRWSSGRGASGVDAQLPPLLLKMRDLWRAAIPNVPQVGRKGDPDEDLAEILAMEASAREVAIRRVLGPDVVASIIKSTGADLAQWERSREQAELAAWNPLSVEGSRPRSVKMSYATDAATFRYSLVTDKPLSETETLNPNYIDRLARMGSIEQIRLRAIARDEPTALLYQLLLHAALREYYNTTINKLSELKLVESASRYEREFVNIAPAATATPWAHFDRVVPALTGNRTIGQTILSSEINALSGLVKPYRDALGILASLPTAELERLFTETMDVCSHRLDAWITSLVSRRLNLMRAAQPLGCHLGAFAWVENLQAKFAARHVPVTLPDGQVVSSQSDSGGFIQAPSLTHAATAAVLRNAYLSNLGDNPKMYEIDLSSKRVRLARWLLDAVRQGQPVGAVLGYFFERWLHEAKLDKFIDPFRQQFPVGIDTARDSGQPVEAITARNVVDGLRLRDAWVAGTISFGANGLPSRETVASILQQLDEIADALSDLLMAESVHQIVRTNTTAASASLDATTGSRPPEPDVAQQPRGGPRLTHRIGIILGEPANAAADWAAIPPTPRALAEPHLDGWIGELLGAPSDFKCRVNYLDGGTRHDATVSLADLNLRPIDVVTLAKTVSPTSAASELDGRVTDALRATKPNASEVQIFYTQDAGAPATERAFETALEVGQTINALLAKGRALGAQDFILPQESKGIPVSPPSATDVARVESAKTSFALATKNLRDAAEAAVPNETNLRANLREATLYGVAQAYPIAGADAPALIAQAQTVLGEMDRRGTEADAITLPVEIARAIFGRGFLFLPQFAPPNPNELNLALAQGPGLIAADKHAIRKWFQQVARVREPLGALRKLALYSEALGHAPLKFDLAQLPFASGATWAALPFAGDPPPSGLLSFALVRAAAPDANDQWCGLFVDDWTEQIPNAVESTGIAFHYDDPGAEAAQAVLLAVPPTEAERWNLPTLADILNETIDLAKMRGVDAELLPALSQFLPMIFAPENVADETFSTRFARSVVASSRKVISVSALKP